MINKMLVLAIIILSGVVANLVAQQIMTIPESETHSKANQKDYVTDYALLEEYDLYICNIEPASLCGSLVTDEATEL